MLKVAGVDGAGSSAGSSMCAAITASAPRSMPRLNGTSSTLLQPRAVEGDHRQAEMAVDVGVAVPGKMFDRRDHPAVARAGDVGADQRRHARRIFAVRRGC